ncbi:MAG: PTS lactose/cellobiose transporter subunit IIA, partial [Oscillospiraceae bacterium]|nr:PTS lactose/cellobiose transporter subunit IIA [Oscillospiraceae bacterium]MBO5034263.1 PTS lactose/cellobiose transporter subunit IIA [Oscillospiraceae bacterium]
MNIIVEGGNARSLAMEAIQEAKKGNIAQAEELLKECGDALTE